MVYVCLAILFFLFQNIANKEYGNKYDTDVWTLARFHLFTHMAMALSLIAIGTPFSLPGGALALSFVYAVAFICAIMMLMRTYTLGPAGKTALIVNLSMLLSVLLGVIIWKEQLTTFRILGIPCVLMCLFLSTPGKSEGKGNAKWLISVIITFFLDGSLSIIQKTFITLYPNASTEAFVLDAALFGLGILAVMNIIFLTLRKTRTLRRQHRRSATKRVYLFLLLAVVVGASTAIATMFNMKALEALAGVIVFPVRQGGLIVLMTVYGIIRYKDKLDLKGVFMMLFGLAGIMLLNF